MPDRMPSLRALRAFEAVARHLSFSKAAEELHVSQAAVSQQIKALELELGGLLLRRGSRQVELTDTGRVGLIEIRESFDLMARGVRRMRAHLERQLLTIRVEPTFAATWLVARLDQFRRANEELDVLIDTSLEFPDFDREGIDIAICFGTGDHPRLEGQLLFRDVVFPVCSPRLLHGLKPLNSPADLAHHTLLHLETVPGYEDWPYWHGWLRAMGAEKVDASHGMRFTDHAVALQAAVEGEGVALGTTALVADYIASGRLVAPFEEHIVTKFGYYLVWPGALAAAPKIVAFRNWIFGAASMVRPG
ncbi:MAG: transcriptional regulator GcvA [Proteobacteria bacterium]|nr:transcriptional regulator GcvA [Pseudomonadota bacterium]